MFDLRKMMNKIPWVHPN